MSKSTLITYVYIYQSSLVEKERYFFCFIIVAAILMFIILPSLPILGSLNFIFGTAPVFLHSAVSLLIVKLYFTVPSFEAVLIVNSPSIAA